MTTHKKSFAFLLVTILLFLVEVLIALYVHDNFVRPYLGDTIVVILIYSAIRIFVPEKVKMLPLYVFLFACLVEFLQYVHILDLLGLGGNRFLRIVVGTSFSWLDILAYAAGTVIIGVREIVLISVKKRQNTVN